MSEGITHRGTLWRWTGATGSGSWYFLTIDSEAGETIAAHEAMRRLELGSGRGFGSVKVEARIGDTRWNTSVFPSQSHDGYLLPLKAAIRKAEKLVEGSEASVSLNLI